MGEMESFYKHYPEIYPTNFVTRRAGELYQVEDVFMREGKLMKGGGRALIPSQEFKAVLEPPATKAPLGRLIRRGR